MRLIVGLGNPGREYRQNRHNIGFHVVDQLATVHGLSFGRLQNQTAVVTGMIGGQKVCLAKPQSFMNRSGGPVASLVRFYKVPLDDLIIVYDELDLPQGTIRLRADGGHGGHNGMRSIIEQLGSSAFARLRVGIGRPPGRMDAAAYVLQDFRPDEEEVMAIVRPQAVAALECWLSEGITVAMNRFNGGGEESHPRPLSKGEEG